MSAELITYGADRRLVLGGAEAVRAPIYMGDWATIRIGLQMTFDAVALGIPAGSNLIVGVCAGSANVMVAAAATHLFGWRTGIGAFSLDHSGNNENLLGVGAGGSQTYKKVGSTITATNQAAAAAPYFSNATAFRCGLFVDIKKTAPTAMFVAFPFQGTSSNTDFTDLQFTQMMELSAFVGADAGVPAVHSGMVSITAAATIPTIDEATNGLLDHIFVYWDKTINKVTFNIRHRKIN